MRFVVVDTLGEVIIIEAESMVDMIEEFTWKNKDRIVSITRLPDDE